MRSSIFYICLLVLIISSCGQQDTSESSDGIASGDHRVFITSSAYSGSFGGISQANAICSAAARSANLKLNYKAILSNSASSAINNIILNGSVYTFDDNDFKILIVDRGADVWDNNNVGFINPINRDEFGLFVSDVSDSGHVWTGTNDTGNSQGDNCSSWNSNSGLGRYGKVGALSFGEWLEIGSKSCASASRFYCVSI